MLVLTRQLKETIRIGDNITITVTQIGRNRVQLGIVAPKDTKILRGEIEVFEQGEDKERVAWVATKTSQPQDAHGSSPGSPTNPTKIDTSAA